jgi:Fe-S-cluster-containing hydrogenase component 2
MRAYEKTGVLSLKDLTLPAPQHLKKGVAILECVQEIPCNPCVDVCPVGAITMDDINAPPHIDYDSCISCGRCVAICPGLAIFMVQISGGRARVTLPYEMLPLPKKGDEVWALDREGNLLGTAIVDKVITRKDTPVVTVEVAAGQAMDTRAIRVKP